jgi:hypothetical protein
MPLALPGLAGTSALTVTNATSTTLPTTTATSVTAAPSSTTTTASTTPAPGTSLLIVRSQYINGTVISGLFTVLYQDGAPIETGYTPAQFVLVNGQTYQVQTEGYGSTYFQYWTDNNWVNAQRTIALTSSASITGAFCSGTCSDARMAPPPLNGITVYASRISASYWAPCFATACSAGSGPGASMYFVLEDSNGNFLQGGFADEWGLTFTGLNPGATYYVLPEDCNLCHNSSHDVVFQNWDSGSTVRPLAVQAGAVLKAWYSCTNMCAAGP